MTREAPSLASGDQTNVSKVVRQRVLDPVERASEILFGLIMVLTFTLSIVSTEAGRTDVDAVLVGGSAAIWHGASSTP
jgi:hypothetical protein